MADFPLGFEAARHPFICAPKYIPFFGILTISLRCQITGNNWAMRCHNIGNLEDEAQFYLAFNFGRGLVESFFVLKQNYTGCWLVSRFDVLMSIFYLDS